MMGWHISSVEDSNEGPSRGASYNTILCMSNGVFVTVCKHSKHTHDSDRPQRCDVKLSDIIIICIIIAVVERIPSFLLHICSLIRVGKESRGDIILLGAEE